MKNLFAISGLLVLLLTVRAAEKFPYEKAEEIKNVKATVKKTGETWYLSPVDDDSKRYIAFNLPEELKMEGFEVKVSGYTGKIPPMIKMMGTPCVLYKLRVVKKPAGASDAVKKKYTFEPMAS